MKKLVTLALGLSASVAFAQLTQIDLPVDWEGSTVDYTVTDFGGNVSTKVVDPTNASNQVLKSDKPTTAQTWAGTTIGTGTGFATAIPFSTSTVMLVDVWSANAGTVIRLKAEDATDPTITVETEATTTVAGGWQTLSFDFANQAPGTAALNTANTYDKLSIFYNFNVVPTALETYYCDSIRMGAGSTLTQIDLPIDWEGSTTDYTVSDFGNNVSQVVVDPTNSSNMVLESVKPTTAPTWAGTTLSTPSGLASAIPFAQGSTVMTINVWSPDAGIEVRLKAEDATDPTITVETIDSTTVAGGWQTMTFDFANQVSGTAAINFANTYDKLSIFYNFGVDGATAGAKTYYCDDVVFGSAPPAGTHNVTFQVDMNNYTGSFTTPEVNGDFNVWCGNCAPMSDANNDGIWDITIPITADSIEFKFAHDNWSGQENLTPGSACTKTSNGFTNRFMYLTKDTVLDVVCWEACTSCAGAPQSANVTFRVDVSETGLSWNNVNLNGTFNNWCGACAVMTDADMDSIYEITVTVPQDTIEYKFTMDGWSTDEQLTSGDPCTITIVDGGNTFINRIFVPTGDTTLPVVCWEACAGCDEVSTTEFTWINDINIFPNPSYGIVQVDANLSDREDVTIEVVSMHGQVVYKSEQNAQHINERIDLSSASNGMYMIRISNDRFTHAEKIVISH